MIQSIYLLPHGMQVIPGLEDSPANDFSKLNTNMMKITDYIKNDNPDLIILITPHGYADMTDYLIYYHSKFQGFYYKIKPEDSVVYGDLYSTKFWDGDISNADLLIEVFENNQIPYRKLIQGGSDYAMTLAWGETVPLFYLPDGKSIPIIPIGVPRSRYDSLDKMQTDLDNIAKSLVDFSDNDNKKISIIISGDMSHTHIETGPYGFHETCTQFDELIQEWVKNLTDDELKRLLKLNKTALACGMAGICIIQYLSQKIGLNHEFSFYDCPTYFGMIISKWDIIS